MLVSAFASVCVDNSGRLLAAGHEDSTCQYLHSSPSISNNHNAINTLFNIFIQYVKKNMSLITCVCEMVLFNYVYWCWQARCMT